jgi:diacylglycerol O-acyltransferase-1
MQFFLMVAFVMENLLARKGGLYEPVAIMIHQSNARMSFATCIFIVWNFVNNPTHGGCVMLVGAITWMKLVSYFLANQDYCEAKKRKTCFSKPWPLSTISMQTTGILNIQTKLMAPPKRQTYLAGKKITQHVPCFVCRNMTLGNLYYFWCAPSLTYQIGFPKKPRVQLLEVLGLFIGMVITLSLFVFLIHQIVSPTLNNLLKDLEANGGRYTYSILANYWLKPTITKMYTWLMVFYF